MSDAADAHRKEAREHAARRPVRCAVLTVSDTRTRETDRSGDAVEELLVEAEFIVIDRRLVRDEPEAIGAAIDAWLDDASIAAILTTGGTGMARRDTTIEVVRARITTELEGFGELFRMISYEEIGSTAMLSRAVAGLARRDDGREAFIFAMPGSTNAVRTAMTRLIVPELPHLLWQRA